jgi:hypothetical protein
MRKGRTGMGIGAGAGIAVIAVSALGLAGCTGPQPGADADSGRSAATITSEQALERYPLVADDLVEALTAAYPDAVWELDDDRGPRVHAADAGGCLVSIGPFEASPSLVRAAGGWEGVSAEIEGELADAGFAAPGEPEQLEGGWMRLTATDADGAVVQLRDKARTELLIRVPVTDETC